MDNKQTLLHYMVRFLEGKHPELLEFYAELTHIRAASELSLQSLQQEVKHLTQGLQQVKKEVRTLSFTISIYCSHGQALL